MKPARLRIPPAIDPTARELLEALRGMPEARALVLGGYLALAHYGVDYRPTQDIDAWWRQGLTREELAQANRAVEQAVREVARRHGYEVERREWRSVLAFDILDRDRDRVFGVQIAERDVELEEPVESPWSPLDIETLVDNIASKMVALVDRGAPRDFTDISEVVRGALATVDECWALWQRKTGADIEQAKLQLLHHLGALEARRPIGRLPEEHRPAVEEARRWYREQLIDGIPGIGDEGHDRGL